MCLHPKIDLYRNESTVNVVNLEKFDTCDYMYSIRHASTDDLIIVQLNVRGLYNKRSLLANLLSSCVDGRTPDIVLLSETWLTPTSPPVIIPGYDLVHCCRTHKRGGGVGILVSTGLRYTTCKSLTSSIEENECITIELELRSHEKCIISSMYRPPNVNIQSFQCCYNSLVCEMNKRHPKAIIIGLDHNLDFLKSESHSGTSRFIQHNLDFNLIPTITRLTRVTKNSVTLIDNIMVSQSLCGRYDSGILVDDISDHMPSTCVIRSLKGVGKDPIKITLRDTRPRNMDALKRHLASYD